MQNKKMGRLKIFNRNILYCKYKIKLIYPHICGDLIGTFCIVNSLFYPDWNEETMI